MIGTIIEELFEWLFDFSSEKIERGWRRLSRWGKVLAILVFIAVIVGLIMLCQMISMPASNAAPAKPL